MAGRVAFPDAPTARQAQVLAFIRAFIERHRASPSFDDIARNFGLSAPSVNSMIKMLEKRGFISRSQGVARSLKVLVPETWLPASEFRVFAPRPDAEGAPEWPTRTACLIINSVVRALATSPDEHLRAALRAVMDGLDKACLAAGSTQRQRLDAREAALRAVVEVYQSVRGKPGKRGTWDTEDVVLRALFDDWPASRNLAAKAPRQS